MFTRRLKRYASVAMVVGMLAHAAPGAEPDPALRTYQAANGFLHRGMNELAIREYRAFLDQRPNHEHAPTARYGLGVALFRMNQLDAAVEALSPLAALRDFEFAVEVDLLLGQAQMAQGDYAQAAERFEAALKRKSDHPSAPAASAMLIESLQRANDPAGALRAAEAHFRHYPNSDVADRVCFFAALAAMTQQDYARASQQLERLLAERADSALAPQATLLSAQCAQQIGAAPLAIRRFREAVASADPALAAEARFGLGTLLQAAGELDEAGALLDQFLAQANDHPHRADALLRRAQIWLAKGQYERAGALLNSAADLDHADDGAVAYWLAKCALRQDRPDEAARRLTGALEANPTHALAPEMMYDGAVAFVRTNEAQKADALLSALLQQFPDHALAPDALALRGSTLNQLRQFDAGAAACAEFLRRYGDHPHAPSVQFLLADNLSLAGRLPDAAAAFEKVLARAGDSEDADRARFRLGTLHYQQEQYVAAERWLTPLASMSPIPELHRPALLMLGEIAFQAQQWDRAERYFEQCASQRDAASRDAALLKLGMARQRQNDHDAALQAFDQLIRQHPDSSSIAHAHFERGQSLVALGQTQDAAAAFERALKADADASLAAAAHNHLGAIAAANNDHATAITHFESALAAPADAAVHAEATHRLGRSLMSAGRSAEAAAAFERLNREFPSNRFALEARARQALALAAADDDSGIAMINTLSERDLGMLDPALAGAVRYEKAWRLRTRGETAAAEAAYIALLRSDIDDSLRAHAMVELADLSIAREDFNAAAETLQSALHLSDNSVQARSLRAGVLYRLGMCRHRLNAHHDAATHLTAFLNDTDNSDALIAPASLMLAESLFQLGRHRDAAEHFETVVSRSEVDDQVASSLLRLGECHAAMQRWTLSEQAFADFLSRFSDSPLWFQAQFGVGWAREHMGRIDDAIDAYRRVAERHDGATAARAQFQIGECLFAQRRHEDAIAELLKVDLLFAYPEWSAAALYEAGRCFEALGKAAEARELFQRVRAEFANTQWAPMAASRLAAAPAASLPGR